MNGDHDSSLSIIIGEVEHPAWLTFEELRSRADGEIALARLEP